MRVFYGITFYEKTKEDLEKYKELIASDAIKGRFTDKDNFHLTLEFIGDVDSEKIKVLTDILHKLSINIKKIVTADIGSFERKNKEIVWIGIKKDEELMNLQRELRRLLIETGFDVEDRKYTPHITVGRQIIRKNLIDSNIFKPIQIEIKSIALMESKRVDGKLVYEPLDEILL